MCIASAVCVYALCKHYVNNVIFMGRIISLDARAGSQALTDSFTDMNTDCGCLHDVDEYTVLILYCCTR